MALGILFDGYLLKTLRNSDQSLTRNTIRKRLEKLLNTTIAWETIDTHLQKLRREGKIIETTTGKIKLYKIKS